MGIYQIEYIEKSKNPKLFKQNVANILKSRGRPFCDFNGSQLGSNEYWDESMNPDKFDRMFVGMFKGNVSGFILIVDGFRCIEGDDGIVKCSYAHRSDTWYIDLICADETCKGLGKELMEFCKKEAKTTNKIKYITLSAIERVISYYWKNHSFHISLTCKDDEKTEEVLADMADIFTKMKTCKSMKEKALQELNSMEKPKRGRGETLTNFEKVTETLKTIAKSTEILEDEQEESLFKLLDYSTYYLRENSNIRKSEKLKTKMEKIRSEGVYMMFCLHDSENKVEIRSGKRSIHNNSEGGGTGRDTRSSKRLKGSRQVDFHVKH
jgi:hypothetical protein